MKPTLLSTVALVALLLVFFNTTNASTYYWISTTSSANNNWSTLSNWALGSCGGSTPTSLPGTSDSVVFSGGCTGVTNCTIDVSINVLSFRIDNSYSGTITQSSGNAITAAYGKFADGTFSGSNAAITFSTSLTIEGGSFTTTSGTTTLKGHFSYTGGTFYPNGGRVVFYTTFTVSGVNSSSYINLYDAEFQAISGNTTITLSNIILDVADSTLLTGSNQLFINASQSTSVINAGGEVKDYNTSGTGGGTATIVVNGSSTQHITGNATTEDVGKLPNLNINSTGTVYLIGYITMGGSTKLTYTAGTVSAGTSNVVFYYDNTITGNMTFNNIEFQGTISICSISNTITVNGNVSFTGTGYIVLNTGTVNISGNLNISNTSTLDGGSAVLNFDGSVADSIIATSSVTLGEGLLPIVHINKTGGTLYLSGNISVQQGWTNNYTTANINPRTSNLYFGYVYGLTIGGTYPTPLWNVTFGGGYSNEVLSISADSALSVHNNLTINSGGNFTFNGHSINILGNLINSNTGGGGGGSTVFNFVGSANDSIIASGITLGEGYLPAVKISKTGGTFYLIGNITVEQGWTNNYSSTSINAGASDLFFNWVYGTQVGGTYTTPLWNLNLGGGFSNGQLYVNADSAISIHHTLSIGYGTLTFNGHSINLLGNLSISNTATAGGGSTVLNFVGSANDSIISTSSVAVGDGVLPIVHINKTGGTFYLSGNISVNEGWTNNYTTANINPGTSTLCFSYYPYTLSIGGSYAIPVCNIVFGGSTTLATALNVANNLTISSGSTFNTSSSNYQINIAGNWINNGTYTGNNSNVTFNGSGNNYIEGSTNTSFYSLTLNQSGTLTLSDPVTVTNSLTLTNGDIISSSTDLLTLNNGTSVSGGSDNSFVNGPMKKIGNSAFTFPTGANSSYHPIGITAPSSTSDAFEAQYAYAIPAGRIHTDDSLTYVSACDYWLLSHPAGSSSVTTSLFWGTGSCAIERLSSLRVGYYNTTTHDWTNLGQSASTGTTTNGSVTAATSLSISTTADTFAISKHSPTPIASAGSSVSICYGSSTTLTGSATGGLSPYAYTWSPFTGLSATTGSTVTANPTATTTYTVTAQDNDNAPTAAATVVVTVNPLPTVTVSASSSSIYYNTSSTLITDGAVTYTWSPSIGLSATTGSSVIATLTATTTYTVTGTDANGCINTATQIITVDPQIIVNAGRDTIINTLYGDTVLITLGGIPSASGGTSPYTYSWSPSVRLSNSTSANPIDTIIINSWDTLSYTLTVTDSKGYSVNAQVKIMPRSQGYVNFCINDVTYDYGEGESCCSTSEGAEGPPSSCPCSIPISPGDMVNLSLDISVTTNFYIMDVTGGGGWSTLATGVNSYSLDIGLLTTNHEYEIKTGSGSGSV